MYRDLFKQGVKINKAEKHLVCEIEKQGCIVLSKIEEATFAVFVPGVRVHEVTDNEEKIIERSLVKDCR